MCKHHTSKKNNAKGLLNKLFVVSLVILLFNISYSQEEKDEAIPEFMEMRKPNFNKIKRRAEKYFKKEKLVNARLADTDSINFENENKIGGRAEDNEYHRYKRWEWFWRYRVNNDGTFPDQMKNYEAYKKLQNGFSNARVDSAVVPTWKSIGMSTNSGGYWGLGQARSVAIFPSNPSIYYVTTVGGGIWKTTNGGTTYTPIGDNLPQLFCGNVLVDPTDANIVYVNVGGTGEWWLTGLGVYKTTNGGTTWTATGLTGTRTSTMNVKRMVMSPTDPKVIIAGTNNGLYRTTNGGTTWTRVRSGEHGNVIFRPGDGSVVYAASDDYYNGSEIYKSTDGGATWIKKTSLGKTKTAILLSCSAADANFVAAVFKTDGVDTKDLYVSTDKGETFTLKSSTMKNADIFYMSQQNKNTMYGGAVNLSQSTDGGTTWTEITNWCCGTTAVPEVHADYHGATHNPNNKAELFFCNDGGLDKYNETTKTWTKLSNGLVITMYYKIASSETNNVVISGGTQDNGGNKRNTDGTWRNTTGGDATVAIIDPTNANNQYSSYVNGDGFSRTTNGWTSYTSLNDALRADGAVGGDWATPYVIDQTNPSVLIAGYQDVLRSTNKGTSWTKISTNLTGGNNLQQLAIAPSNGAYIYAAYASNFYRTINTGSSWTAKTSPAGDISRIVVSNADPLIVYITTNGGNGKKIYKSTNGGDSWTNITLDFPNDVKAICIAYEKGSNEGLYVGSPIGVFYKNASMTKWIYYGKGLPNTEINDISIAVAAKKIRVGTWGRGIWETSLYAEVVTNLNNTESTNLNNVFPNPFTDNLNIELNENEVIEKMYTLNGAQVAFKTKTNGTITQITPENNLPSGIYLLDIKTNTGIKVVKISKQ